MTIARLSLEEFLMGRLRDNTKIIKDALNSGVKYSTINENS
jgi:hypothetical protein